MFWALVTAISLHLAVGGAASKPVADNNSGTTSARSQQRQQAAAADSDADSSADSSNTDSSNTDSSNYDPQAERQLLDMANGERGRAGLAPLKMDNGLVRAARAHATKMAAQNQLSHQFSGEPPLPQRLAASSSLHLERTGENVAMAADPDQAHHALMSSPPHRDNLLSPNYNVAGFGVIRSGHVIFVAQDFGSSLPSYSVQQAQDMVDASVEQLRAQAKLPRLQRVDSRSVQSSACAMAQADSLSAAAPPPGASVLRYSSMTPEALPSSISKVIAARDLHTYSAGTCYARTQKYPSGAYWVVLVFY
jgi:uncharacterized protein YkwD